MITSCNHSQAKLCSACIEKNLLAELKAKVKKYEKLLFKLGAMETPPCFRCGYNGAGYFQPDVHTCAKFHHCKKIVPDNVELEITQYACVDKSKKSIGFGGSMTTHMILIETPDFKYVWECAECHKQFKDTKIFCKNNTCPNCQKIITDWHDFMEEESDE